MWQVTPYKYKVTIGIIRKVCAYLPLTRTPVYKHQFYFGMIMPNVCFTVFILHVFRITKRTPKGRFYNFKSGFKRFHVNIIFLFANLPKYYAFLPKLTLKRCSKVNIAYKYEN